MGGDCYSHAGSGGFNVSAVICGSRPNAEVAKNRRRPRVGPRGTPHSGMPSGTAIRGYFDARDNATGVSCGAGNSYRRSGNDRGTRRGEVITDRGAVVSEDFVACDKPLASVAGCTPMSAKRFTVACCMFGSGTGFETGKGLS